jgi:hypothetical protein
MNMNGVQRLKLSSLCSTVRSRKKMFDAFSASLDIPFGRAIDELIQDFSLSKNQVRLQMLCSMGLTN